MSDIAVHVEHISKSYQITHSGHRGGYKMLREDIVDLLKRPFARRATGGESRETFWALNDVSFDVKYGEVLGIIGRNGAGKSTLLKILSRITKPTSGRVDIYGRIGSLLEVGTGFHPELTGRENVFLNGAVLGMTRRDIQRHFDEIVAFAEVEQFLDTPVKRYSSGMYMRLAFAVAAHLEPEVLIVDEVLAVGDAEFQRKCLGKMSDVAKGGRTVLFVSHNMSAIETLCKRALLLQYGKVELIGEVSDAVSSYLSKNHSADINPFADCIRGGNGKVTVSNFSLEDQYGNQIQAAKSGEPAVFTFAFDNHGLLPTDRLSFGFSVQTLSLAPLFYYYSHFSGIYYQNLPKRGTIKCALPELPLSAGTYFVGCRIVANGDQNTGEVLDYPQAYATISVNTVDYFRTGNVNIPTWGPIVIRGEWFVKDEQNFQPEEKTHV